MIEVIEWILHNKVDYFCCENIREHYIELSPEDLYSKFPYLKKYVDLLQLEKAIKYNYSISNGKNEEEEVLHFFRLSTNRYFKFRINHHNQKIIFRIVLFYKNENGDTKMKIINTFRDEPQEIEAILKAIKLNSGPIKKKK
jgi:hypothetical protein